METTFTPFASLGGGALIGLASILLMWTMGKIMGATGILAGFMSPISLSDWSWRAAVMAGMVSAPLIYFAIAGQMPAVQVPVSNNMLIIGGFIVGIGVTLGNGCTSGHGICGIARFSPRSIVATIVFMIFTAITVYIINHVLGV